MVESWKLRKLVVLATYALTITVSLATADAFPEIAEHALRATGIVLFALTFIAAYRIHRMYPARHDKPSDFPHLLTTGPYAICRHPFYGALIANQLSITLAFASTYGIAVWAACIPLWLAVIKVEEQELLKYWGEKYREYMRRTPMLIPLPKKLRPKR